MESTRFNNSIKNAAFSIVTNFVKIIINFGARYIFIKYLGIKFLGVNGLFSNILGVLNFAELGFGTAMNFSLYKPIANDEKDKIIALMSFYKKVYRIIAIVVALIGLTITPFLHYLIKDSDGIGNFYIYYVLFLFNTVISYLVSYKYSLPNAYQKNYIQNNIAFFIQIITAIVVSILSIIFKNFLIYLVGMIIVNILSKVFESIYLNKKYPELIIKSNRSLNKQELGQIKKNVSALVYNKVGEISVHQTDNIIVSAFINVATVGILSNYNLIIISVTGFLSLILNSVTASFGNLFATAEKAVVYTIFKAYRFLAFWLYGFSTIAIYILATPFITLFFGEGLSLNNNVVFLICLNQYLMGHRICINNIKIACGVFSQDKFIAILQALVNLVFSIILVKVMGITGVFIATVFQGLIASIAKPIITYPHMFGKGAKEYFLDGAKYLLISGIALIGTVILRKHLIIPTSIVSFLLLALVVVIFINIVFWLFTFKTVEYIFYKNKVREKLKLWRKLNDDKSVN